MNEQAIINGLMRGRWLRSFVMPNYCPNGWWECDIFEITKAGYFVEYEIKLTVSDFKRDSEKSMCDYSAVRGIVTSEDGTRRLDAAPVINKHALIASGDIRGPKWFYFVTPAGLLDGIEIPPWAGLIEVSPIGPHHILERCKVAASQRHTTKLDEKIRKHAESVSYYRFHRLRQNLPLETDPK